MKILFITPHLSTGGAPQYLLKKVQELINDHDVYCIEYADITGGVLVVQRNQIKEILKDRLITIGEDKHDILSHISNIAPEVIHFEEMPEYFCDYEVGKKIYNNKRTYKIIETSHDSSFNPSNKVFIPDAFIFVSEYQKRLLSSLNIPSYVVEYPITYKQKTDRTKALSELGLDPSKTHFLNVGLFTSRKNQKEIIQYARNLLNENVQFHFVGNQADNFRDYWEPLMKDFPHNCKWWGERKDVDTFYNAMDVFLFTSRGTNNDKETSPLVLREAIGWGLPVLMYNLPVYCGMYDKFENITYLSNDLDRNLKLLKNKLSNNLDIDVTFQAPNRINLFNNDLPNKYYVSIKDYHTNIPMYHSDVDFTNCNGWYMVPNGDRDFTKESFFSAFTVEFYDLNKKFITKKVIKVKDLDYKPVVLNNNFSPFNCLYINYKQMFYEDIYSHLPIDNLNSVLDLGANVGLFTLYMLRRNAKFVHSFEPVKKTFKELCDIFVNDKRVHLHKKAIYNINGKLKIKSVEDNSTISGFINDPFTTDVSKIQEEEVDVITLNSFLNQYEIKNLDLIKIDIEGAEYEVIADLSDQDILKCKRYIIEYHSAKNYNAIDIVKRFKSLNYSIVNKDDPDFLSNNGYFYAELN